MKPTTVSIWILSAVVVLGLLAWAIRSLTEQPSSTQEVATATSTLSTTTKPGGSTSPAKPTGSTSLGATYANATYHFSISYPKGLTPSTFGNFHLLNQNDWRLRATSALRGTPVIEIPVLRVENESKKVYPPYYTAAVRVGISPDVTNCYTKDPRYENQTVQNVTINGVVWKKFIFGDAAMQQYVKGASYRTVRNNLCYAVEQIENGSHYYDASYTYQYTDDQLKATFDKTTPIVMSFTFTK